MNVKSALSLTLFPVLLGVGTLSPAFALEAGCPSPQHTQNLLETKKKMMTTNPKEAALEASKTWLEAHKKCEGVKLTSSGLQYSVQKEGDKKAASPKPTDKVRVHYEGRLLDGTVFDSSYKRGEPAVFPVGALIPGWVEALQLMKPGDVWEIALPPDLAYGDMGAGSLIGPNEALIFKMELLDIVPNQAG